MSSNKPTITVIPATISRSASDPFAPVNKKRVAAYARVSTDKDEQLNSYEAQVDFYTNHIKSQPDWIFVEVYADEGTTGVMTKGRDDFNRMIQDALDGKIDFIITKSVARFARNTVDSLVTVRKLKEKGVEVYFEKENIYTLDYKGELMITIMSSMAQEESRSISENVTWGQRKRMQDGKVTMPYKHFLGYEKGEDGIPQIVEGEAEVVRRIYAMFLDGKTYREIAALLTGEGTPTPSGRTMWSVSTVQSILKNEKYAGNAVLQKRFTVDFLTKTSKVNEGEVPQYFVENSHPAIVTLEIFELAQEEIQRRKSIGKRLSGSGMFVCKVVCGDCGGFFGSKVWHSNSEYRRMIWQCNHKYKNENACQTPHLTDENIKTAFVLAWGRLLAERERLIAEYESTIVELTDTDAFDEETARLQMKYSETVAKAQDLISQNARTAQDQERYKQEFDALTAQSENAKAQLEACVNEKQERAVRRGKIRRFLDILKQTTEPLAAFDEKLWHGVVESLVVRSAEDMTVIFQSGTEIVVAVETEG